MSIQNATLIDTSKVNEIENLIGDKLIAYRYNGEALFTSQVLNSDASGYNTISYYDTEFGYIDCTTNKFHKVGQTIPLAGINAFSSDDRRYLYYVYAEFPENASYPRSQQAVSYTHLDVYKRQVAAPGENNSQLLDTLTYDRTIGMGYSDEEAVSYTHLPPASVVASAYTSARSI